MVVESILVYSSKGLSALHKLSVTFLGSFIIILIMLISGKMLYPVATTQLQTYLL